MSDVPPSIANVTPKWRPMDRLERRVLGVLVEKAKTTPDAYPLSLNALVTGCNQKNNRDPVMGLEADDIEPVLERLRAAGAIVLIEGSGRVQKYRHLAYEWFGVTKPELGVLTELLLRGAQTEGELRGRADRMDRIPDLAALRPLMDSLREKKLVIGLTPEGRGHIVSHNCYTPEELEKVRRQAGSQSPGPSSSNDAESMQRPPASVSPPRPQVAPAAPSPAPVQDDSLRREVAELRQQVGELRSELAELSELARRTADELREVRDSLGG